MPENPLKIGAIYEDQKHPGTFIRLDRIDPCVCHWTVVGGDAPRHVNEADLKADQDAFLDRFRFSAASKRDWQEKHTA